MTARRRMLRLMLGLVVGLAFFGCVGLPRRRSQTDAPARPTATGKNTRQPAAAPPREIPRDPVPVADDVQPAAPRNVPAVPVSSRKPARDVEATPGDPMESLKRLHTEAKKQHDELDSYIVRLTRREVVRGKKQPEEQILFMFRKSPKSVYLKWIGPAGQGREAIWVDGKYEGKLHTLLAAGDMLLTPAGKRIALAPDNVLVRSNSRHSITEAGVGTLIDRFGELIAASEKGAGQLTYLGRQKREEFVQPVEGIEWAVPPGADPGLPKGGRRWCWIDPESHLPALIVTHDERGNEVEYYRYDRYQLQANLDDADFDPDFKWGKRK